jgi:hypothetical protein
VDVVDVVDVDVVVDAGVVVPGPPPLGPDSVSPRTLACFSGERPSAYSDASVIAAINATSKAYSSMDAPLASRRLARFMTSPRTLVILPVILPDPVEECRCRFDLPETGHCRQIVYRRGRQWRLTLHFPRRRADGNGRRVSPMKGAT